MSDEVEARAARRAEARHTLGVTGKQEAPPLMPMLRAHQLTLYPMFALGVLGMVDNFQAFAFAVFTPEVSQTLGISIPLLGAAVTVGFIAQILSPLAMARLAQGARHRALICIVTGVVWSLVTIFTGFVSSLLALVIVFAIDGFSTGSVLTLHSPLVADSYPPSSRVRVMSAYISLVITGQVLSPLFVALLAGPFHLTWRGCFLVMGITSTFASLFALRLRDPGPGRFDTELLRATEHERVTGEASSTVSAPETELRFWEICRRVLLIPTVKRVCVGYFVLGLFVLPFRIYLGNFLDERWGLSPAARGLFIAGIAICGVVALLGFASYGERVFAASPPRVFSLLGVSISASTAMFAFGAVSPLFPLTFLLFAAGWASLQMLSPAMNTVIVSVIDARYRAHATAVGGIFAALGSLASLVYMAILNSRFGSGGAIFGLIAPGVVAGLVLRSARRFVDADIDRLIDEVLESEDVAAVRRSGGHLPLLACRGIDFSYGQLQVLFDVDFTVDEGEMVALLGVNGAGKSTLLKVISGIGLPSSGTVRLAGEDITYLDAERRVPLGITQVPGGRAVFRQMDVVENLRTFGHILGRDAKRIDRSIDEAFEAFPRLYERRTSLAATLSGGEQQMLGLSKALILDPKLLLIDELSLGLAPVVVGQLLDMVRRINAGGTAVVLVEQSVNVALSLVQHAYFMEKGEMQFDGKAADLLARDDLLRAVFLEGAAAGTGRK